MAKFFLEPEEFREIYSKVPKLTVEAVVRVDGGLVMVKRSHQSWHGKWHFPGATVGYREAVDTTLGRLVADELGMRAERERLWGYLEYFSEVKERGFGYSVSLVFVMRGVGVVPSRNEDGEEIGVFERCPKPVVAEHVDLFVDVMGG